MSSYYNKLIIYEFEIEAVSPIYFGGSEKGELVKDSEEKPFLFGNSIGGSLRNYLTSIEISQDVVLKYLGGHQGEKFLESRLYISDGKVMYNKVYCKEGTKVNPMYGSAEKNYKYTIEYLAPQTVVTFRIECEIQDQQDEKEFNKFIGTWQKGFENRLIKLGGLQNNGFGEFKLNHLKKLEYIFSSENAINSYIFSLDEMELKSVENLESYGSQVKRKVLFSMSGEFPYGVYQGFLDEDEEDSKQKSIQDFNNKYYLPASSFKGVVKNEIRNLLSRFIKDEIIISKKLNEIFGEQDQKGKIMFFYVILENAQVIKTRRFKEDENKITDLWDDVSTYIKVDRLTGGASDGSMIKQKEICGDAELKCVLMNVEQDDNPYIFPLIYAFKRIGEGLVPLGGRTSIGLGEFFSTKIEISGMMEECIVLNESNMGNVDSIKKYYDTFEGWCSQ